MTSADLEPTGLDEATGLDRRALLKRGAAIGAGTLLFSSGAQALTARAALAKPGRRGQRIEAPDNGGYGPIGPVKDKTTGMELLHLPADFEYASFGHSAEYAAALGLPTTGSDGFPTPARHDGMAAFATDKADVVRLVRNHEQGYAPVDTATRSYDQTLIGNPDNAYDKKSAGGCTTLTFNTSTLTLTDSFISINGTSVNCAGGLTPAGSWLTCEETVNGTQNGFAKDHGYVFEVPADGGVVVTNPVPFKAMGRFAHEAVAVDPATGTVYETEDNGKTSGFYRFLPASPGNYTAGKLQMLAVKNRPQFLTYEGVSDRVGNPFPVEWVDIANPDPAIPGPTAEVSRPPRDQVFQQGFAAGGAAFARLEGAWYDGGSVFFNSTSGGDAGFGQVWEYRPRGRSGGQLILLFESPSADLLDAPDNICVSPRGGLALCEDGDGAQFVRGLTERGEIFDFALNNVSENKDKEFAGACYSPDGDVMFVNIQTPGVSFAIRGPFAKGSL
jgi:secreted PhoX family phosphatase